MTHALTKQIVASTINTNKSLKTELRTVLEEMSQNHIAHVKDLSACVIVAEDAISQIKQDMDHNIGTRVKECITPLMQQLNRA